MPGRKEGLAALALGLSGFGLLCYGVWRDRRPFPSPPPDLEQPLPVTTPKNNADSGDRALPFASSAALGPAAPQERPQPSLPRETARPVSRPMSTDNAATGAEVYAKFLRTLAQQKQEKPIVRIAENPEKKSAPGRTLFGKYNIFSSDPKLAFPGAKFKPVKPGSRPIPAAPSRRSESPAEQPPRRASPTFEAYSAPVALPEKSPARDREASVVRLQGRGAPSLEEQIPSQPSCPSGWVEDQAGGCQPAAVSARPDAAERPDGTYELAGGLLLAALAFVGYLLYIRFT